MNEDEAQLLSLMIRERLETMVPQQPVDATPIVRDIRARPPFDDVSEDEVRAALFGIAKLWGGFAGRSCSSSASSIMHNRFLALPTRSASLAARSTTLRPVSNRLILRRSMRRLRPARAE